VSDPIPYDQISAVFDSGADAGLAALAEAMQKAADFHGLYRTLLLRKRHELGLPLLGTSDLSGCPADKRKAYEEFTQQTCRETGMRCLEAGKVVQAWRYLSVVGDRQSVRDAIEKLDPKDINDEIAGIALRDGIHPPLGFEWVIKNRGLEKALDMFEAGQPAAVADKPECAALLVRALYKELVLSVGKAILEHGEELPPEADLVEMIRNRQWLFSGGGIHANARHIGAIAQIGLLCQQTDDLIMALSINEYGRMLDYQHHPSGQVPFDQGFADYALYARALLGQEADYNANNFRCKLISYAGSGMATAQAELVILLFWRMGQKEDALDLWQQYMTCSEPEKPGTYIPSFYDLCIEAGAFKRMADAAKIQDDVVAWAAARALEAKIAPPAAAPENAPATTSPQPAEETESLS
jgi:hypothetical protein